MGPLPGLDGVRAARDLLRPRFAPTPLEKSEALSLAIGAEVFLKNETVSPVASFKLRGALVELLRQERAGGAARGAITSSTGNHGQGVACAARMLGLPAHVYLPLGANPTKRAMIESFGASIHDVGRDIDEAKDAARAHAEREGLAFVDDGESLGVMEGGGTVGLEIAEALPGLDALYVPMGSGSLAAGCGAAVKGLLPSARVVAAQAKGSPAMAQSFLARRPVERPIDTIADGLVCRVPARLALAGLLAFVDDAVLATDAELLGGVRTLAEEAHLLAEPSGAAGLVAAWRARENLRGRRVAIVVTGSNVTLETLRRALEGPALFAID